MEPIFEIRGDENEAILIFEDGRVEGVLSGLQIVNRIKPRLDEFEGLVRTLRAQLTWRLTADELPNPGQLIVKRFANGNVWAGVYNGGPKESSFPEWKAL